MRKITVIIMFLVTIVKSECWQWWEGTISTGRNTTISSVTFWEDIGLIWDELNADPVNTVWAVRYVDWTGPHGTEPYFRYKVNLIYYPGLVMDASACECYQSCYASQSGNYGSWNYYPYCDPEWVQGVDCYELGDENPEKPLNPGSPISDGKWVHVKYRFADGSDSTFKTVLSGGCSAITVDGDTVERMNAHDHVDTIDGVGIESCYYNGRVLSGSCYDNGLDTGCGGEIPLKYTNKNDSILNDCKFGSGYLDGDEPDRDTRRADDSLLSESGSGVTGQEYMEGMNRLSSDLREEHSLDREEMIKNREQQEEQTGLLSKIKGILQTIKERLTYSDTQTIYWQDTVGMGDIDSGTIASGDTGTIFDSYRSQFGVDSLDTTYDDIDTAGIQGVYDQFKIDIYEEDCECNSEWFVFNDFPIVGELTINICGYGIEVITKPLLKLMAIFVIFVFYRESIFKALMEGL